MQKPKKLTQCSLLELCNSSVAEEDRKQKKVANSAIQSTLATCYHLYLAVQECLKMKRNEKVYIESFGDITLKGNKQIEVKFYGGSLTDSHLNLWNTLKNWMDDSFNPFLYKSLLLHTTQPYGATASISELNHSTSEEKLNILKKIYDSAQDSFQRAQKKEQKKPKKEQKTVSKPQSLKLQDKIFETSKRNKLKAILDKFYIVTNSPNFPDLCDEICDEYLKHIPLGNREDLLNALVGYVIKPTKKHDSWDISFEDFSKKFEELNLLFSKRRVFFPTLTTFSDPAKVKNAQTHRFAEKITEIEYEAVLNEAFSDYCFAMDMMKQEIHHAVPAERHTSYFKQIERSVRTAHRMSCHDIEGANREIIIKASKKFYDQRMYEQSPQFKGFDDLPDVEFKNGVIHILFDDEEKQLRWYLDENL